MQLLDGVYGNVHINGVSEKLDNKSIDKLYEYLEKYEKKTQKLINEQNEYLSKLIG